VDAFSVVSLILVLTNVDSPVVVLDAPHAHYLKDVTTLFATIACHGLGEIGY
jgi:hypothetical protein